jgi:diguanylate cyclase (GGDEF)-like protein
LNSSLALVAVEIIVRNPEALVLLLAPCGAGALAFRAYSSQRQRHEHLEFLYDTMRATQASPELEGAVRELLVAARRTFKAEVAEVVLTLPDDARVIRSVLSNDGEWLMQTTSPTGAEMSALEHLQDGSLLLGQPRPGRPTPEYLTERGFRDAIVTALHGENRIIGALVIANRASDVSTFTLDDKRLFEAFAAHAAVLLENDRLEQSIAELTELKEQLHHQALHDSLTGLPNRRLMLELANDALAAPGAGQSPPTMLFLDLDDFKTVNDSLGHLAGDELLGAVAKRLTETLRPEDTAAGLGGDEFAVLVHSPTSDDAMRVARRLLARLDAPFTIGRHEISVRATVGIAMAGPEVMSAQDLLRNADLAMYAAKGVSKQRYALYRNEMKTRVRRRHELVAALERAADDGEISVHYQPIVTLKTGKITAFEALVRWDRPGQALMYPSDDFLHLAEETGLVVPIGRRVLADACQQIREWQTTMSLPNDFAVTVNLSARELQDPRLVKETALLLGENGLNASSLAFEITESTAMSDPETILATMHELRRLGVRLALDDFGTGYSSLSHLCDFPIDLIKIGKPFVDRLGAEGAGGPFTNAIFRFADSLSLDVVAEGIEQPEQVGSLRDLNCRLGQGFHFSRPMAPPAAEMFLLGVFDTKARRAA